MTPVPFWWRMGARIRRRSSFGDFLLMMVLVYAVGNWLVWHAH